MTAYFCVYQEHKKETLHTIGSSLLLVGVASAIPVLEVTTTTGVLKLTDWMYLFTLLLIFGVIFFAELRMIGAFKKCNWVSARGLQFSIIVAVYMVSLSILFFVK